MDWQVSSSGYAAVWANENTRASIWDAMERKETYATTGPRMEVRFFGGWDFDPPMPRPAARRAGYAKGVPMGGDLAAPDGKAPTFLVAALRDPIGANLDRIQIVKGWLDDKGDTQSRSMMWSGVATASRGRTASCRRSAAPWMSRTPSGRIPSARRN